MLTYVKDDEILQGMLNFRDHGDSLVLAEHGTYLDVT